MEIENQRERWGGHRAAIDEEDEFDALFEEQTGIKKEVVRKEIGSKARDIEAPPSSMLGAGEELGGLEDEDNANPIDQMQDEVPEELKAQIVDLEAEQQEKLRQTMLR